MRIHVIALLTLTAAGPAMAQPESRRCNADVDHVASRPTPQARARPLNEMPPARPVLTVLWEVDGCDVLLVRQGGRIVEEPVGRPERRRVFRP